MYIRKNKHFFIFREIPVRNNDDLGGELRIQYRQSAGELVWCGRGGGGLNGFEDGGATATPPGLFTLAPSANQMSPFTTFLYAYPTVIEVFLFEIK